MHPFVASLFVAGIAVGAAFATAQDPKPKPVGPKGQRIANAALVESMQGCWRLKELHSNTLRNEQRQEVGYCLVTENYFSIELHWGWMDDTGTRALRKDFQSGMHRFEIDHRGRVVTSTMVGSFVNREEKLEFEAAGKSRTYDVQVDPKGMTWKRDDGTRFVFERVTEGIDAKSRYGRPKDTAEDAGAPRGEEPPK
jgi:hypothetical protein